MKPLADFLNHGILPFTGRAAESGRIMAFWESVLDMQELRALLMTGEAGVGKTRLLAETLPQIGGRGGMVIHARLYPQSANSIIALIVQEILCRSDVRGLLRAEPEESMQSVVESLRRLSRLRPTLIVLEDIHLLDGDAIQEFATLSTALADETLGLLAVARPVQLNAKSILDRFLIDEVMIPGLSPDELRMLWQMLFESDPPEELLLPLVEATEGNPLALRSALRSAIRSGVLVQNEGTNRWYTPLSPEGFAEAVRRDVRSVSEGMCAHLSSGQKEGAIRLAILGEVFARESAAVLIDDADGMIEELLFRGILTTTATPIPLLAGEPSDSPLLSFTHSLLHQHLLMLANEHAPFLPRLIADGFPLYSIVPFQVLGGNAGRVEGAGTLMLRLIEETCSTTLTPAIRNSAQNASDMIEVVRQIVEQWQSYCEQEEQRYLQALLLRITIESEWRHRAHSEEFQRLAIVFVEYTVRADSEKLAILHLGALGYHYHISFVRQDVDTCQRIWHQVDEILAHWPALEMSFTYLTFLRNAAQVAWSLPDLLSLRLIEARVHVLLKKTLPESIRSGIEESVLPEFLRLYETEEELQRRLHLLRSLPEPVFMREPVLLLRKAEMLESVGLIDDVLALPSALRQRYLDCGLVQSAFQFLMTRLVAEIAAGLPLDTAHLRSHSIHMVASPDAELLSRRARGIAIYLSLAGVLRGDINWVRFILDEYTPAQPCFWPEVEILIGLVSNTLTDVADRLPDDEDSDRWLLSLVRFVLGDPESQPAAVSESVRNLLGKPPLQNEHLLPLHAVASLLLHLPSKRRLLLADIDNVLAVSMNHSLQWLADRSISPYMTPILDRYGVFLSKKELLQWRSHARKIAGHRESNSLESDRKEQLSITMIGTISFVRKGQEPQYVRGARVRTVLGLLVAARMLSEPLSNNEFCHLAAGGELDIDLARKTANMGIVRLREAIGAEAVVTGEETYELNFKCVRVDLLEASDLLKQARRALHEKAMIRAWSYLRRVLDLYRGEVPFPGLYDDFFEALRSDFESTLRSLIVAVATMLLREGDADTAREILARGFAAIPEDEEMAELLQQALAAGGRQVDAERVRMKVMVLD